MCLGQQVTRFSLDLQSLREQVNNEDPSRPCVNRPVYRKSLLTLSPVCKTNRTLGVKRTVRRSIRAFISDFLFRYTIFKSQLDGFVKPDLPKVYPGCNRILIFLVNLPLVQRRISVRGRGCRILRVGRSHHSGGKEFRRFTLYILTHPCILRLCPSVRGS